MFLYDNSEGFLRKPSSFITVRNFVMTTSNVDKIVTHVIILCNGYRNGFVEKKIKQCF